MTVGIWGTGQSDFQLMLHSLAKVGAITGKSDAASNRPPPSPSLLQPNQPQRAIKSPLFDIALVLVPLDHLSSFIEIDDRIILPLAAP
jgi:hypothetical protein